MDATAPATETFAERLWLAMQIAGLSRSQFAEATCLTELKVRALLEQGDLPSPDRSARIAGVLDVSLCWLETGHATPGARIAVAGLDRWHRVHNTLNDETYLAIRAMLETLP